MHVLSIADQQRKRQLGRMKRLASGLLGVVAICYVITRWLESQHSWVGYPRAFFEAAMVGALADWFAVTALFRHPLGLPIPHTAIIPNRKDQIGESLGEFVQGQALDEGIVRTVWLTADEIRASTDHHRSPLLLKCLEDYLAGKRFPLDIITTDPSVYS